MTQRSEALATLNAWFTHEDGSTTATTESDWVISEHQDAFVFAPGGGRRSNSLYMVRGDQVVFFAPAWTSYEDAYHQLIAAGQDQRSGNNEA